MQMTNNILLVFQSCLVFPHSFFVKVTTDLIHDRYCVAVTVIGFVYAAFQACDLSYHLATGKHLFFHPLRCYFDFAMDQARILFALSIFPIFIILLLIVTSHVMDVPVCHNLALLGSPLLIRGSKVHVSVMIFFQNEERI